MTITCLEKGSLSLFQAPKTIQLIAQWYVERNLFLHYTFYTFFILSLFSFFHANLFFFQIYPLELSPSLKNTLVIYFFFFFVFVFNHLWLLFLSIVITLNNSEWIKQQQHVIMLTFRLSFWWDWLSKFCSFYFKTFLHFPFQKLC